MPLRNPAGRKPVENPLKSHQRIRWHSEKIIYIYISLIFTISLYRGSHSSSQEKGHEAGAGCSDARSQHCQCQYSPDPDTYWSKLLGLTRDWSNCSCVGAVSCEFIKAARSLLHSVSQAECIKTLLTGSLATLIPAVLHSWVSKKPGHEDWGRGIHHLNCVSWVIRWMLDANGYSLNFSPHCCFLSCCFQEVTKAAEDIQWQKIAEEIKVFIKLSFIFRPSIKHAGIFWKDILRRWLCIVMAQITCQGAGNSRQRKRHSLRVVTYCDNNNWW